MDIGKLFKDAWGLFVKDIGPLIVGMLIASIVPAIAGSVIAVATFGAGLPGFNTDSQGEVTSVDSGTWVVLGVGGVLIIVVVVLLSAPLYAGLLSGMARRVREGREMSYGEAFAGFHWFGRVVWAYVLIYVLIPFVLIAVPTALITIGGVTTTWVLVAFGIVLLIAAMVVFAYLNIAWAYVFPMIVDRGVGVSAAMRESRTMVHHTGWWWTFLALLVVSLALGAVSGVLGLIPILGSIAAIVITPFGMTYLMAMYFQARSEGELVDAALAVASGAAAAPYVSPPAPPAPGQPYGTAAPYSTSPAPPAPSAAPPGPPPAAPEAGQAAPPAAAPEAGPAAPEAPAPPPPPGAFSGSS